MRETLRTRVAPMLFVAAALFAVWPSFSRAWTSMLRSVALAVAPTGTAAGPEAASPLLLASLVAIVGLGLDARERAWLFAGAVMSALVLEAALVIAAARFGVPPAFTGAVGALVQDAVPLVWLFYGFLVSRRTAS